MQRFLYNLREKLGRAMYGSYGQDAFSLALSRAGLVCLILSLFKIFSILYVPGVLCVVWSVFRTFSKNHVKRRKELDTYLRLTEKPRAWLRVQKRRFAERNTHDYYKCPRCKTYNRIPKGHGRIVITCPKCKNQFEHR